MGLRCAPEFENWLKQMGIYDEESRFLPGRQPTPLLELLQDIGK
jgi:ethanolamine ammonia-lyase large subunit